MDFGRTVPAARLAWLLLGGTGVVATGLTIDRDLRSGGLVLAGFVAIGMILIGSGGIARDRCPGCWWP